MSVRREELQRAGANADGTKVVSLNSWRCYSSTAEALKSVLSLDGARKGEQVLAEIRDLVALKNAKFQSDEASPGEDYQDALAVAYKKLSRKALSAREIRRELKKLDYAEHTVELVVTELLASNYIDELAMAEAIVIKLSGAQGSSKAEIQRKLAQRGIAGEVIDKVLSGIDNDAELELLKTIAYSRASKLTDLDYQVALRRLLAYLARRGWSGYQALEIAKEALENCRQRQ
ncbi:recombination regulator RecX [Canibacter sp. lx-45]|uniref:regulatory protein RecX n=1 Tax=Canibacter zhuwentaonis TaxID=2837491 RepID=UPI001BDC4987|nr:recombination regulator RecX [Canibacter zhuwentaonis]